MNGSTIYLYESKQKFLVSETGGNGDCLFSSIACGLQRNDHLHLRREIVDYMTSENNWPEYSFWAKHNFQIESSVDYSLKLKSPGEYGTYLECHAFSQLYKMNVKIVRIFNNEFYYILDFLHSETSTTIWLLFTGRENSNGHFQLLIPKTDVHIEANLILKKMESENCISDGSLIQKINNNNKNIDCEQCNYSEDKNSGMAVDYDEEDTSTDKENLENENIIRKFLDLRNNCKKSHVLSLEEKEMILKVRKFFEHRKAVARHSGKTSDYEQVVKRTAQCLEISERTVKRISREAASGELKKPHQKSGRPYIEVDDFFLGIIRRKIFDFYMEKNFPTVTNLLMTLRQEVPDFPDIGRVTLWKILKKINFVYRKFNKKPILMESAKVAESRREYLKLIQYYRELNWSVYFTDETWCGANHTLQKGWVESISEDCFENYDMYRSGVQKIGNFRGGFVTPSGAGKRVIILHIGNENGFVDSCMKCFIGKKGSDDYHNEMNAKHFEEWFRHVLTLLPKNSVIVLDQAPYHTMLDPNYRNVTSAWKKSDIINWLISKGVDVPEGKASFDEMKRDELFQLSKKFRFPKIYLLDTIAQEMRKGEVKLLWLPVAHCELNPIELIWAYVKRRVARENKTFKINDVLQLCIETMENIPPTLWPNCVRHAQEIEKKYRGKESELAKSVCTQPFIINLGEDSDSEDYDDPEGDIGMAEDVYET